MQVPVYRCPVARSAPAAARRRARSFMRAVPAGVSRISRASMQRRMAFTARCSFAQPKGIHGIQAFVGLDAAQARPVGANHLTAKSLQLGVRFQVSNRMSGQVGYAAPIGGDASAKPRLTFFVSGAF